jgi:hypothetical protein
MPGPIGIQTPDQGVVEVVARLIAMIEMPVELRLALTCSATTPLMCLFFSFSSSFFLCFVLN